MCCCAFRCFDLQPVFCRKDCVFSLFFEAKKTEETRHIRTGKYYKCQSKNLAGSSDWILFSLKALNNVQHATYPLLESMPYVTRQQHPISERLIKLTKSSTYVTILQIQRDPKVTLSSQVRSNICMGGEKKVLKIGFRNGHIQLICK